MDRLKPKSDIEFDSKYAEEITKSVFDNPVKYNFCKRMGLSDELIRQNIIKIYIYFDDILTCKNCKGMANCKKDPKFLVSTLTYNDGVVDNTLTPCKKYLEQVNFKRRFVIADFDEEYYNNKLTKFYISNFEGKEKSEILSIFTNSMLDKKSNQWIYIKGDISSGKSYYAATMCVDAARREASSSICFIDVPERFKELTDFAFQKNPKFNELLEKIRNSEMLVLDDFGNEFKSDFVRENILFPILSYRTKKKLFTIFTSNYSIDDICTMYTTSASAKPKVEQIRQALLLMCKKEINLTNLLSR